MSKVTIWHNPRCSKSRQALQLLEEAGADLKVIKYLDNPPSRRELNRVIKLLDVGAREMMRTREKLFRELELNEDGVTKRELVGAMAENPRLIERPIIINGESAVIGRPPERALEVL